MNDKEGLLDNEQESYQEEHHLHDNDEPEHHEQYLHQESRLNVEKGVTLAWQDIYVYTQEVKKKGCSGPKTLLNGVSGIARPGELLAIMGSSGAGKSTLLNALLYRNTDNLQVEGSWTVNGIEATPQLLTALSGYVQQDDLFLGTLTVKENLVFQAMLRMDSIIPMEERMETVDHVIKTLGLVKSQNTMVGIPGQIKGLSGGEKKRLSVACEVLTNPALLFCDEPTSGLDSYMANSVVDTLLELAKLGRTVVCTIHQPSSLIFSKFDRLMLLTEGRIAYFGDANLAVQYFNRIGYPCPLTYNPADFFLDTLSLQPNREEDGVEFLTKICNKFKESDEGTILDEMVNREIANIDQPENFSNVLSGQRESVYKASWTQQFTALVWREWISLIRNSRLVKVKFIQTVIMSLIIGIVFLNQELDQPGIMNLNGAFFVIIVNLSFGNLFPVLNVFCSELPIYLREHFNGMYRADTYFLTKQLVQIPIFVLQPVLYTTIIYFMVGFDPDIVKFLWALLVVILLTQDVLGVGYLLSCAVPKLDIALTIAPVINIPLLLMGGFYMNDGSIPVYFLWLKYLSWFHYSFEALMINQWSGLANISCQTNAPVSPEFDGNKVLNLFLSLPVNSTFGGFSDSADDRGLINSNVTSAVHCIEHGDEVLQQYGFHKDNFWFDILCLVLLTLLFRVLAFCCLLAKSHRKSQK
uniref:ABCG-like protein 2 n=1 Tax=Eurytemora affinis TaxID=88015 RepID=A0A8B0MBU5_EURAF|nr:ABCG-like protein 2 [Eurytemora affinis]